MALTEQQVAVLNNLYKYDPAWRGFQDESEDSGFGDCLRATEQDVVDLQEASAGVVAVLGVWSPSEQDLAIVPANKSTIDLSVLVDIVFDGLAQLSIGTEENPELLLKEDEVDLGVGGIYVTISPFVFSNDTLIKAFFDPNGSAAGSATIKLSYG